MPPACGVCWEMWLAGFLHAWLLFLDEICCYFVFRLPAFRVTVTTLKLPCGLQVPQVSVLGGESLQHTLFGQCGRTEHQLSELHSGLSDLPWHSVGLGVLGPLHPLCNIFLMM